MGLAAILFLNAPFPADAQVVQGVEKGVREGNKAAGPVGGVLGGAIGGVVGVVTGVTGVLTGGNNDNKADRRRRRRMPSRVRLQAGEPSIQGEPPGDVRSRRGEQGHEDRQEQPSSRPSDPAGAPQIRPSRSLPTAPPITGGSRRNRALRPNRRSIGPGSTVRCTISVTTAPIASNCVWPAPSAIPPMTSSSRCQNEAQFLNDRAVDQRNVADAAEPLFASLDDKQKAVFIQEMVNLVTSAGSTRGALRRTNSRARMPWGRLKGAAPA